MRSIKFNNDNLDLVVKYSDKEYKVYFNIQPEYEMEKVFKNSAFVETGKKILTGTSTANYIFIKTISKPLLQTVLEAINTAIDKYTNRKIERGFVWKNYKVWLNKENQLNYASWLLASKDNESIFPLCAKFIDKNTRNTVFYDFSSYDELKDFYSEMIKYINNCIIENRKIKDNVDPNQYKIALDAI